MDVRIGVADTGKEIEVEIDGSVDEIKKQIDAGISGAGTVMWLTDKKGRNIGIPAARIAFVEFGTDTQERRVGFTHQ